MKRNIIKFLALIFIIIIFSILISSNTSLKNEQKKIINIINKKYRSYEIIDIELTYTDFFSTIDIADESHPATSATAIIENDKEQLTLKFEKTFNIWHISFSEPNYGPNIPNEVYFIEESFVTAGRLVNIDEHLNGRWVIPDEEGNLYKKTADGNYSFKECNTIYKTQDGYVYEFDKAFSQWVKSGVTYADLCYFGNYEQISKEYAIELIERFISYKEN